MAQLVTSDGGVDEERGAIDISAVCQKGDQLGMGRLAYLFAAAARGSARPVEIFADWLWPRGCPA